MAEMTPQRSSSVRQSSIVRRPDSSLDVLADLAGHPDPIIRSTVLEKLNLKERPNTPEGMLEAARRFVDELPVDSSCAGNEAVVIDTSATCVLNALAVSESAPPALLEALASVHTPEILQWVGAHPSAPPSVLRALAQNQASAVREAVAGNPSTPPETLVRLICDESRWVRAAVARNSNTSVEGLVRLSGDDEIGVRAEVAQSSRVTEHPRLALAVRLSEHYVGDPDGLEEAVDSVLE